MKTNHLIFTLVALFMTSVFFIACKKDDNGTNDKAKSIRVPEQFVNIQDAIDFSNHGDTVIVEPGIYKQSINLMGKRVIVQSAGYGSRDITSPTVLDGDGNGPVVTFNSGESNGAVLQGFTIINGDAGSASGGAILITNGSNPVVRDCVIRDNKAAYGGAIAVSKQSAPVIENNVFQGNIATSRRGAAIYIFDKSSAAITNNLFEDHEGGNGVIHVGSTATDESSASVTGNTIRNNMTDFGVGGIKVTAVSSAVITDNTFFNNTGSGDNNAGAVLISFSSVAEIANNNFNGNKGDRAGAIVIYRESEASITGNTITNNMAGEEGSGYGIGGGIMLTYHGEAIIQNNVISDNQAWNHAHGGGGIAVYSWGQETRAVISDNQITGNLANRRGGGIYITGSGTTVDVYNNNIDGNQAQGDAQAVGGGIYLGSSESRIFGNTISNGWSGWRGGGVYIHRDAIVLSELGLEWTRMNCPPGQETNNSYANNLHHDNEFGGSDVFFAD
ncbi:MAG: right-handed parallel beta-helix repeat-containing protein [Bacteroidales bacterium]